MTHVKHMLGAMCLVLGFAAPSFDVGGIDAAQAGLFSKKKPASTKPGKPGKVPPKTLAAHYGAKPSAAQQAANTAKQQNRTGADLTALLANGARAQQRRAKAKAAAGPSTNVKRRSKTGMQVSFKGNVATDGKKDRRNIPRTKKLKPGRNTKVSWAAGKGWVLVPR